MPFPAQWKSSTSSRKKAKNTKYAIISSGLQATRKSCRNKNRKGKESSMANKQEESSHGDNAYLEQLKKVKEAEQRYHLQNLGITLVILFISIGGLVEPKAAQLSLVVCGVMSLILAITFLIRLFTNK